MGRRCAEFNDNLPDVSTLKEDAEWGNVLNENEIDIDTGAADADLDGGQHGDDWCVEDHMSTHVS